MFCFQYLAAHDLTVLSETPYYEFLENTEKIRKYVKQRNVAQLPKSVQDIIRNHQNEAEKYESGAKEQLEKPIECADFYVDGEHIEINSGNARSKLDQVLEYLVTHVYSELGLISKHAESDADTEADDEEKSDADAKADDDTEHLTLEHETELCSDSLGWVGGTIHCHLYSSADKADETEEEEATRTSAA